MSSKLYAVAIVALLESLCALTAQAIVTTNGSISGDGYGAPVAVQTVNTEFGDDLDNSNVVKGSELDAAYARVEGSVLNLAFAGNLEDNFNKLVLFFDSVPGGQNLLDTDIDFGGVNPVVDRSPFQADPGMFSKLAGSSFDPGFAADYVMVLRHGFTGSGNRFDVDFAVLGGATSQYLSVFVPTFTLDWSGSGSTATGAANGAAIAVGFNNSNILGVVAGNGAANPGDATAVTTGVEIGLPLSNIGNPSGNIKITAFVTSSNHDFVSNQFLGGLPAPFGNIGTGNLGTLFTLGDFAGDQFFVVAIPSDYNHNGAVDAADYVVWRKDPTSHGGTPGGYNTWRATFGNPASGSGSGPLANSVPEPTTSVLLMFAAAGWGLRRHRSVVRVT